MKKIVRVLFLFLFFFMFMIPVQAKESNDITIYFFHGDGCPHCAEEQEFLKKYEKDKHIKIVKYEVWYDSDNQELMNKMAQAFSIKKTGVPFTIIGDSYFLGYSDSIGKSIERAITFYKDKDNNYRDVFKLVKKGKFDGKLDTTFSDREKELSEQFSLDIPFIGTIYLKNVSLITAAVVIGLVDGFNPCAMWVLLFLISVLIGMQDKKRMLILGITFLVTSALVYMIIMFSWLNIVVKVSTSIIMRNIIAAFAVIGGAWNLRSYYKNRDGGCEVVDDKRRKKIFANIKKFTHEKSYALALLGVMVLAVSVNVVELACSAGLPLVFTQLLAINNANGFVGFLYTLIYILFFLIDDLIVFIIAVYTMSVTGISTKFNKYSHLIGGILMLIIGLLLIFKYEVLTFGL